MKLVLVESPAKAKTINKYLGSDYDVMATIGHIRNLPNKNGVDPEENFSMQWELLEKSNKFLKEIKQSLKSANKLILATDPDREGEAISWHVLELLNEKKIKINVPIERVVFHEITKISVLDAIDNPRELDQELINASLARNALDYLIGFKLSRVLWQKLPGAKSAGRVQSVALRLICEREFDIQSFIPQEYWTIESELQKDSKEKFKARLIIWKGDKLEKLSLNNEQSAKEAIKSIENSDLEVVKNEEKKEFRNPRAPFTTSTLQQEASRKLSFSASRTMRAAQKLYEGLNIGSEVTGLITYMRTDSVQLSKDSITDLRKMITNEYGDSYCPEKLKIYKSKVANAQEAHEAIRPTDVKRMPKTVKAYLDDDCYKLYDLIWKRTVSSQMASAIINKTIIDVESINKTDIQNFVTLRANGSVIKFDGFLKIYNEGVDEKNSSEMDDNIIPQVNINEKLIAEKNIPEQHFTQPLPRYTDASLIKKLEELGIGRPSTYASILEKLQDRGYVFKDGSRYVADDIGRIVTSFLENYFEKYVEYSFTADLEKKLDLVSEGKLDWKILLKEFWEQFKVAIESTSEIQRTDVIQKIDLALENHFFNLNDNGKVDRVCPTCSNGSLSLKVGKFGSFIACSNYPECKYTRKLSENDSDELNGSSGFDGEKSFGFDPVTNDEVYLKKGPYGIYLQLGNEKKPKRTSIPKLINIEDLNLEIALSLLKLPRNLGNPPGEDKPIYAGIGRFGPYLRFGTTYASLPHDNTVITIGLNHANDLIQEKLSKSPPIINLGNHPDGGEIEIKSGRFGSYLQYKKLRASIPKKQSLDDFTLEMGVTLINEKGKEPKKRVVKSKPKKK
ncbi:MAG: type I DNA topoisomerase [Candidatus Puniceispirillales bacterium]